MIPNSLPTLSAGAHDPGDGKACVMEYVALLAGESWTDTPACTHPVLARMAQVVNDRLPDSQRHLLVPLIGRLFGTAPTGTDHEQKVLSVRLAVWCGRRSLRRVGAEGVAVCVRALDVAEAWTLGEATTAECRAAADAADAADNAANAANAYNADNAAAYYAYAAAYDAAANAANAYNAANAAAAGANAAAAAGGAAMVDLLTGLLDEYDRLTGRTNHRHVTDTELAHLAATIH